LSRVRGQPASPVLRGPERGNAPRLPDFAGGIKAAVDGYWNWQASRAGKRAGKRVGFPRFAKKGRDRDR
jgi:hypothetical protein